ncbi:hypothetical protein [Methylotuvimicrobium sp.]|uniref:hypothetical protein n=1 Tax=Methylotuvimicrobium sp. TaxID=2822413 RepID=UPI003D6526E1
MQLLHNLRQDLVKRRTAVVNQIRGALLERGIAIHKGVDQVRKQLPDILEDAENGLTALCRELIAEQAERLRELDKAIKEQDTRLGRLSQADALSRRMLDVPGVGPITATIVASDIGDGKGYASSRDYAGVWAWFPRGGQKLC